MELEPDRLRAVEFTERRKGYDPEQVERFRDEVVAGAELLRERLRRAEERAAEHDPDVLRRTLVLAQRTADAALAEAREEGARLVAEAEAEAEALVEQARRDVLEFGRREQELRAEIASLEDIRAGLEAEVERVAMSLQDEVEHLNRLLDQLERAPASRLPEPSGAEPDIEVPVFVGGNRDDDGPDPGVGAGDESPDAGQGVDGPLPASATLPERDDDEEPPPADDDFFAELRHALTDEGPLGPGPEVAGQVAGQVAGPGDELYDQGGARTPRVTTRSRRRGRR